MKLLKKITFPLALLSCFLFVLTAPKLIKIKKVECFSQYGNCSGEISGSLGQNQGKSLPDVKKNINSDLARNKMVKNYNLAYKFPSALIVNVIERKPKFAVTNDEHKEYFLVDSEGLILARTERADLPLLVTATPHEIGKNVNKEELFSLKIVYDIYTTFQVREGKIEGNSLIIEVERGLRVIFPQEGERDLLVGSMVLLVGELRDSSSNLAKSGKKISSIDLRYKNPVLK